MTDEQIVLARRAVACKNWRWMPGMATNSKFCRVVAACPVESVPCCAEEGATEDDCYAVWLDGVPLFPDLTDSATLGCLLALVREAYGDPYASIWYSADHNHSGDRWSYYSKAFSFSGHATEADALVAALEGAP